MKLVSSVLSIVFPRTCLSCGSWGDYFCAKCSDKLKYCVRRPICPVCIKPSVNGATHPRCLNKYSIDGLISIFRYRDGVKRGIQKVKYQRQFDIADALTTHALAIFDKDIYKYYVAAQWFLTSQNPIVVAIPLHWRKKRSRWFNQSDYYAHSVAQHFNLSTNSTLLSRTKYRAPQAHLNKQERLENVKGIFQAHTSEIDNARDRSILLVDDVWTTGATMREAANTLKRSGVKNIWGITINR